MIDPKELQITTKWACHDATKSGSRTSAAEVSANLACKQCGSCPDLGSFTWPPVDSDIEVANSRDAIDGAADQALIAASDRCIRDCSIEVIHI